MQTYGSQPTVLLDGATLPPTAAAQLTRTSVETDLLAPSVCRLVFADGGVSVLNDVGLELGTEIEIRTSAVGEEQMGSLFRGRVYALEYEADETGGRSVAVAYDAAFALRQRRSTSSYNDVTDGDVVRQVCDAAGVVVGEVAASDVVHPYLAQLNETDWDFLCRRALANDCIVHVADGKLHFQPSPTASSAPEVGDRASSAPLQLAFGRNLTHLQTRTSAASQVEKVEVRGWDPVTKSKVVGTATAASRSAETSADPTGVASRLGAETLVIGWPHLSTEPECSAIAASAAEESAGAMAFAEGRSTGDPRLLAGGAVSIGATGRFDGKYTVSTARHVFDLDGYFTEFTVSGGHDRSLYGLLSDRRRARIDGFRPATITNVQDPEKLGRVKVKFPWLADDFESNWSRVVQIGAGNDRGIFWFPEVDDEVLVSFMDGDVSHPVVVGGMYNGIDAAPLDGFDDLQDGSIDTRCLRTRAGHMLEFSDLGGDERIRIVTADETISIELHQADGALRITTTGDVEMRSDGSTSIVSGGDLTLEAGSNLKISATGSAEVTGQSGLALSSSGAVDVAGAIISLN